MDWKGRFGFCFLGVCLFFVGVCCVCLWLVLCVLLSKHANPAMVLKLVSGFRGSRGTAVGDAGMGTVASNFS